MSAPLRASDYQEEEHRSTAIQDHSCAIAWRKATYYWSTALLIFALSVVLYGIGKQWNNPPWEQKDSNPALEIFLFLLIMWWIALLEGCQISIVGLQFLLIFNGFLASKIAGAKRTDDFYMGDWTW